MAKIGFSSNRNQSKPETNVFIADWVDDKTTENVNEENLKSNLSFLASDNLKEDWAAKVRKKAEYISNNFKN